MDQKSLSTNISQRDQSDFFIDYRIEAKASGRRELAPGRNRTALLIWQNYHEEAKLLELS